jgi:hypothetical protein
MNPPSNFDITRRHPAGNASALLSIAAPRGFALGAHQVDPEQFTPATGVNFIGHLTRDVVVGGLTLADRVFGRSTPTPTGLAGPFTVGDVVTVEKAMELEAEGTGLLNTSGTGALSAASTVGTKLSFLDGLLYVAQSGDNAYYTLTAVNLPASDGTSLRIRAEKI